MKNNNDYINKIMNLVSMLTGVNDKNMHSKYIF